MQETLLVLWEKRKEFAVGSNFKAWAFKVAYFEALTHRRELQRNKVITLPEDILNHIAGAAEQEVQDLHNEKLFALKDCLRSLLPKDLKLLYNTYVNRVSLTDQATKLQVPANRLQKAISRLRFALRACIDKKIPDQS